MKPDMKLLVDASAFQRVYLSAFSLVFFFFVVVILWDKNAAAQPSYLLALFLGPRCHSCLQSVQLGHDEAGVFPQGIRALVPFHLLSDPRVLLPESTRVTIRLTFNQTNTHYYTEFAKKHNFALVEKKCQCWESLNVRSYEELSKKRI